jgi:hypothetical protein
MRERCRSAWGGGSRAGSAMPGWGSVMYPVVYWAGVTTLLIWTAYSAYSAIIGL